MLRVLLVSLCALCNSSSVTETAAHSKLATANLLRDIEAVKHEKAQTLREKQSEKMLRDIITVSNAGDIKALDDQVIDDLIPLLDDDSDIVRGWTACALKYFGPRAHAAIPFLERAEKRVIEEEKRATQGDKVIMAPTSDSTDCIDQALDRIRGQSEQ